MAKYESIEQGLAVAGVARARHHLFLCRGPDCAPLEVGEAVWNHLKKRCAEMNLPVMRSKAGCLRVCVGGPWLLVYPEGVWYGEMTPERCDRVLQEHIVAGRPVAEWTAATHPLCGADGAG